MFQRQSATPPQTSKDTNDATEERVRHWVHVHTRCSWRLRGWLRTQHSLVYQASWWQEACKAVRPHEGTVDDLRSWCHAKLFESKHRKLAALVERTVVSNLMGYVNAKRSLTCLCRSRRRGIRLLAS